MVCYGDESLSHLIIYERSKRFKEGWGDSNDDELSGRQRSAVNEESVEIVREFIKKKAGIFVPLHGNGIECVQRFNLSHFDQAFVFVRG